MQKKETLNPFQTFHDVRDVDAVDSGDLLSRLNMHVTGLDDRGLGFYV
jgi:hypothetical protein